MSQFKEWFIVFCLIVLGYLLLSAQGLLQSPSVGDVTTTEQPQSKFFGLELPATEPDIFEPTMEDFTGGLNEVDFPNKIKDNEATEQENFIWGITGGLEARPGYAQYNTAEFDTGARIWGLYSYYTRTGKKIVLAGTNDGVWGDSTNDGTFYVVDTADFSSQDEFYDFATFKNVCLIIHEGDFPLIYDGDNDATYDFGLADSGFGKLYLDNDANTDTCRSYILTGWRHSYFPLDTIYLDKFGRPRRRRGFPPLPAVYDEYGVKYYNDDQWAGYSLKFADTTGALVGWSYITRNTLDTIFLDGQFSEQDSFGTYFIYSYYAYDTVGIAIAGDNGTGNYCFDEILTMGQSTCDEIDSLADYGLIARVTTGISTGEEHFVRGSEYNVLNCDIFLTHAFDSLYPGYDRILVAQKRFWKPSFVEVYKNRVWLAGIDGYPNLLVFSQYNNYGDFNPNNYVAINTDDGDQITGLVTFYDDQLGYKDDSKDGLIVFKNNAIYKLTFISSDNYYLTQVVDGIGCVAPKTIRNIEGKYLLFLHSTGVYAFDGRTIKLISQKIDNTVKDIERNPYHDYSAAGYEDRHYYLSYPGWNPADTTEEETPSFEYIQEVQVCYNATNDSSSTKCQIRVGLVIDGDSYWHSTRDTVEIDSVNLEVNGWSSNPAEGRVWLPQDIEELTVRLASTEVMNPSYAVIRRCESFVYWYDTEYNVTRRWMARDSTGTEYEGFCNSCESEDNCTDESAVPLYGTATSHDTVWAKLGVPTWACCYDRLDSTHGISSYIGTFEPMEVHDCQFQDSSNYLGKQIDALLVRTYQYYLSYVENGGSYNDSLDVGAVVNNGLLINETFYPYETDDTLLWRGANDQASTDTVDHIWTTNPATELAWTGAEINDAQWRVRSNLIEGSGDMRVTQLYVKVIWGIGSTDTTILLPFGDGTKDEWTVVGASSASEALDEYPDHDTNTTYIHCQNLLGPWQDINTWTVYIDSGAVIDTAWGDTLNVKTMALNIDFGAWAEIVNMGSSVYAQQKAITDTVKLFFADNANRTLIYQFGKVSTDTGEAVNLVYKSKAFDFNSISNQKRFSRFFANYYLLTGDFSVYFYTDFGDSLRYNTTVTDVGGYRYVRIPLDTDCRGRNFSYKITSSSLLELGKIRLRFKKEED